MKHYLLFFFLAAALGITACAGGDDDGDGGKNCPGDVFQCPDGSYVSRDPGNNCSFFPCPATKTCTTDADCAKVAAGCCSCNAGGKAVAIHKNDVAKWNEDLQTNCKVMCPAVISNDPSCKAQVKCRASQCVLE